MTLSLQTEANLTQMEQISRAEAEVERQDT